MGFVVGSVVGRTLAGEACPRTSAWRCAVKGGAIYGGIGMMIGAR